MKILVVDDEVNVVSFIKTGLVEQGHDVDVAYDGKTGLNLVKQNEYDFCIFDIIMPHVNGLELCQQAHALQPQASIIMLTALKTTNDIVHALDSGADDYLTKPFRFEELVARIRAIDRRKKQNVAGNILKLADLEINLETVTVKRADKIIKMTSKEFLLLEYLLRNAGKVISRVQILENVWEVNFDFNSNVVDVYINYLRNKIDKGFSPQLLHTVIGMGYIMKENED